MATQTQPFIDLIREAEEGTLQLPELQRPWNWATQNVVKLFDSVRTNIATARASSGSLSSGFLAPRRRSPVQRAFTS